ncbi:MAG TPA: DHA2 family efflux MFS transporter permease subunit [Steroidobacteraceae bacterium]|jgi:DHA2 family multidrug resistance protein|nr:DHA2 family efflux MFS transporter permease subunit [Steroidobacteraceae bacterium]
MARPFNRPMIVVSTMLSAVLQALDNTIANVALPHMQGTLSATMEEMSWVLTSYIVAAAVTLPLSGWLADRYGRKRVILTSVIGFTIASALCGMAQSLDQILVCRVLQGIAGASLMPMSQAVLFDIYPPSQHGKAMSLWGIGVTLAPTLAPMLGGWLTDNYSWRWVFYINVPFGILAIIGLILYYPDTKHQKKSFDFFGFIALSFAVGFLQIFLDRGPTKGWFDSTELKIELAVCALAFYLFLVHSFTAKAPFVRLSIYKDRNYFTASLLILYLGVLLYSVLALIAPLLQGLLGYSVLQSGSAMAPRGVGTLVAMLIAGRLVGRVDSRLIIVTGLAITAVGLYQMSHFSMTMDSTTIAIANVLQGFGTGATYVPLAAIGFMTLPAEMRNEASALFNLLRNLGSSVGISTVQGLLVHNTQVVHAALSEHVTAHSLAQQHAVGPLSGGQATAALNDSVTAQATMIAYLDDFHLMLIVTIVTAFALLFLRNTSGTVKDTEQHAVFE